MTMHSPLIRIPPKATTLRGFVAWAKSDAFPECGRLSFLRGEMFIDMSPEEIETHNKVKTETLRVVANVNAEVDRGELFSDGTLFTNEDAELSTEADGLFVRWQSYRKGQVRLVPRKDALGQFLEVQGSPDWALEVVSRSSWEKDTVILRHLYHRAGIAEFWLINALEDEIDFQILAWRRQGYSAVKEKDGWLKSRVFGRAFRLERRRNRMGRWQYKLCVRPE